MRLTLATATLLFTTLFAPNTHAAEWEATLLGLKMNLPDAPGWGPFKSAQPDARIARQNVGSGSLFVLTARAIPDKFRAEFAANPKASETVLQSMVQGATRNPAAAKTVPEKTAIDGIPAYRLPSPPTTKDGHSVYSEIVFWVHREHLFSLNLMSTSGPVAENPELIALLQSIRLVKP